MLNVAESLHALSPAGKCTNVDQAQPPVPSLISQRILTALFMMGSRAWERAGPAWTGQHQSASSSHVANAQANSHVHQATHQH